MKIALTLAILILAPSISNGQNMQIDTALPLNLLERKLLGQIDTAETVGWNDTSQFGLENIFVDNLVLALNSPRTFEYPFGLLTSCAEGVTKSCIRLINSDDNHLRIFNWRSPTSGSLHHSPSIIQAKNSAGKILIRSSENNLAIDGDIGGSVSYFSVYRLRNTELQLYIAFGAGQGSGRLPFETVEIFEVKDDVICDSTRIIVLEGKLCYDIFIDREATRYDVNPQEIPRIEYDPKRQIITVPEIVDSEEEEEITRWNGKLIKLKFDGKIFNRIK